MNLTDEVLHNCLTAVSNEGRVPTYYLWSMDLNSSHVQKWLIKMKYIKLNSEVIWISKLISSNWVKKCPSVLKVPTLTFKGLWAIWVLRHFHPDYDIDFVDWDDIKQ